MFREFLLLDLFFLLCISINCQETTESVPEYKDYCKTFNAKTRPYMESINDPSELYWPIHFVEDPTGLKGSIYILPYENSINMSRMFEPNCKIELHLKFIDIEIKSVFSGECFDELQFLVPGTNKLSSGMEKFPRCRQICDPGDQHIATPDDTRFEIRFTSNQYRTLKGAEISWKCRNRQLDSVYKVQDISHENMKLQLKLFSYTDRYESMTETIQINRGNPFPKYDCNPDYVNWTGSQGMTCQMYLDSNWCTPDGQLGDFGKHQKIRMAEMAKNGYQGANCPQCGCGEQITQIKRWHGDQNVASVKILQGSHWPNISNIAGLFDNEYGIGHSYAANDCNGTVTPCKPNCINKGHGIKVNFTDPVTLVEVYIDTAGKYRDRFRGVCLYIVDGFDQENKIACTPDYPGYVAEKIIKFSHFIEENPLLTMTAKILTIKWEGTSTCANIQELYIDYTIGSSVVNKYNLVKQIGTLYRNWRIAFDIMPTTESFSGHMVNIIRVGTETDRYSQLPAVYMKASSTILEFRTALDGKQNYGNLEGVRSDPIPLGDWTHVEISQFDWNDTFIYLVRINGVEIHRKENSNPEVYSNIMLYENDHFWESSTAHIRNIVHETYATYCYACESTGFTLEEGCDYMGSDILDDFGPTDSFLNCVKKCKRMESTHNCISAMWNSETTNCHLKDAIGDKDCTNPNKMVGRQCNLLAECRSTYDRVSCNLYYQTWKDSRGYSCQDYGTSHMCNATQLGFSVFNRPTNQATDC